VPPSTLPPPDAVLRRGLSPAGRGDPYPWLASLREHHPVHRTTSGAWVFSRYADVLAATRDPALAVKDPDWFDDFVPAWRGHAGMRLFYSSPLFRNGHDHQRLRKVMSAAFAPARLGQVTAVAQRAARQQADSLSQARAGGPVDLHGRLTLPTTRAAVCALIGAPAEDGARLHELVQPLLALLDPTVDARAARLADQAAVTLTPYLAGLVAGRRRRPANDLASLVAPLPGEDAASVLALTLAAGFDTTTTLLDNALILLMTHPGHALAVAGSTAAAAAAVSEALRYDTPVHVLSRVARRETAIGGARIVAGQEVMALPGAAHRDPAQFPDPDTFRLDRPAGQLLSFGGGPHYCPGARLARQLATLVLPQLLRRFPRMVPACPPQGSDRVTLRGWRSIPVFLTPESSAPHP
jgi:cytochrome P450